MSKKTWGRIFGFAAFISLLPSLVHGQAPSTKPWDTYISPQIPDGAVNALWLGNEQRALWVGTDNGLGRYDGHKWQSYGLGAGLPAKVRALNGDGANGVWVGTSDGLGHFDGSSWQRFTIEEIGLPDNWINVLSLDRKGGLWVGTMRGFAYLTGDPGHYRVDPQLRFTELDNEPLGAVRAILPTQQGGAFFAVANEIIYISSAGSTKRYGSASGLQGGRVQSLAGAGEDDLWAATESGLYRLVGETFELVPLANETDKSEPDILSMVKDGAGGFWLGTKEGLCHFDGEQIDQQVQAAKGQLVTNRVLTIARMEDGTLWLGTSGGLNRWNPDTWRDLSIGSTCHPLAAQENRIWAIVDQGLMVWENEDWIPVSASPDPWPDGAAIWFSNIFSNVEPELYKRQAMRMVASAYGISLDDRHQPNVLDGSASGDLWLGTDEGVFHFSEGKLEDHYDTNSGLPSDLVQALLVQKETIWVGTDQGLAWWDGQTWNQADWGELGKAKVVRAIVQGNDECKSLWVGTAGGLWRLPQDKKPDVSDNWQRYMGEDGLASSEVNALWADSNGQLWVGTAGGLSGLDDNGTCNDKSDDVWVTLTADDGLTNSQVTALWRDSQGALWVATGMGERTALIRHIPTPLTPLLSVVQESRLSWWALNLTLEFNGASLVTDQLFYRYQLPGENWQHGQKTTIPWNPSSGDSFSIHVFDTDLNSTAFDDVSLDIPWWQRLWGYWWTRLMAYAATGLGLLALAGQEPARRWWRGRRRADYRETWEITLSQARPDLPVCTVQAQQHFKRDVRLLVEGQAKYLLSPSGETIATSLELPDDLQALHNTWREAVDPSASESLDALAHSLAAVISPDMLTRRLQETTSRDDYRVRLRLNFAQAPALAAYPWEVSCLPGMETLGLDPATAISRWLPPIKPSADAAVARSDARTPVLAPLQRHRKLKVLLVVASPRMPPAYGDLPKIETAIELKRLEEALANEQVTLDVLGGVGAGGGETELDMGESLAAKLMSEQEAPDIVHFIGHAGPHPRKPEEIVLYFEDNRGHFRPLGAERLVEMIRNSQNLLDRPKLLVLNACQTAAVNGGETLAGLVPALVTRTGLMAVIGMQYPISDEAAAIFASTFYRELLQTQPADYAVSRSRQAIKDELGGRDWAAPVLYMQVADGMLYEP